MVANRVVTLIVMRGPRSICKSCKAKLNRNLQAKTNVLFWGRWREQYQNQFEWRWNENEGINSWGCHMYEREVVLEARKIHSISQVSLRRHVIIQRKEPRSQEWAFGCIYWKGMKEGRATRPSTGHVKGDSSV